MTVALLAAAAVLLTAAAIFLWRLLRFRAAVLAALARSPDLRVAASSPLHMTVEVSGFPVRVNLVGAFSGRTARRPEDFANTLRARVPASAVPPLPLVRDRILPVLKRAERLPAAEGYVPANRVVRVPFDDDVVIAYVIEGQFRMTFVTEAMLEAWRLDTADLHAAALENLRAKTAHLLEEIGGPQADYVALDGYDAARLLVADMLIPPGVSDPVLAIPHEHALLIRDRSQAPALREAAAQAEGGAPLPLTPRLYRWTPQGPAPANA